MTLADRKRRFVWCAAKFSLRCVAVPSGKTINNLSRRKLYGTAFAPPYQEFGEHRVKNFQSLRVENSIRAVVR